MKNLYIVGDCFSEYAELEKVYTVADLLESSFSLPQNNLDKFLSTAAGGNIVIGQGISIRDRASLLYIFENHGIEKRVLIRPQPMCGEKHTHKYKIENSLITIPKDLGDKSYSAYVFVSDKNELIQDHVTGNHIQGMIVVEAFRQLILATIEEFYSTDAKRKMSFIWKDITTEFKSYIFPIDISVSMKISKIEKIKSSRYSYQAHFTLEQKGSIVCTGKSEWDTLDSNILKRQEAMGAIKSIA